MGYTHFCAKSLHHIVVTVLVDLCSPVYTYCDISLIHSKNLCKYSLALLVLQFHDYIPDFFTFTDGLCSPLLLIVLLQTPSKSIGLS